MNCKICNTSIIRQEGIYLESRKPNDFKKDYENEIFICAECNKYPLTLIKAFTSDGGYIISLKNGINLTFKSAKYVNREWMHIADQNINNANVPSSQLKIEEIAMIAELTPIP